MGTLAKRNALLSESEYTKLSSCKAASGVEDAQVLQEHHRTVYVEEVDVTKCVLPTTKSPTHHVRWRNSWRKTVSACVNLSLFFESSERLTSCMSFVKHPSTRACRS